EWTIQSTDPACTVNAAKHLIKCVLYGEQLTKPLRYTLKAPAVAPAHTQFLSGDWKTLTANGTISSSALQITPAVARTPADQNTPAPAPPVAVPDNTMLFIAIGAIALVMLAATGYFLHMRKPKADTKR
ncbi:MAG: hypothetical protein Q7R47_03345, partial [Candidatus Diapherotrites archaeon]|nr:hypothetical protein [Candidatus Diapherotrites archaeon]